ncbi:hypothetical protein [Longimicrobium sp.]|uniref:hypothetical protein n=1 Tax=Longimicrobium sp. TaxID=2029185 RepID=UPI002CBC061D|nr:hypothetical protein [Longimicrobium sp.]HSU15694.1 hypothetical protein [Longimicrobium sp.]
MSALARWTLASRASAAALVATAALAVMAFAEWRDVQPLPRAPRARAVAAMPEVRVARRDASDRVVLTAVERDPFRADRRRPPGRYRMPGEPAPAPVATPAVAAAPPPVYVYRLLGTVVTESGGLAAIAGPSGEGKVVRLGQPIDQFRLVKVTPGSATLAGHDTTLVLKSGGSE